MNYMFWDLYYIHEYIIFTNRNNYKTFVYQNNNNMMSIAIITLCKCIYTFTSFTNSVANFNTKKEKINKKISYVPDIGIYIILIHNI